MNLASQRKSVAWIFAMGALCLTVVAAVAARIDTQNWPILSAGKAFTLRAPQGTEFKPLRGIDSFVGSFVGPQFKISFDYGPYSNDLSGLRSSPGISTDHISVDGREAVVVTGPGRNNWGCTGIVTAMYLVVSHNAWTRRDTRLEIDGCTKNPATIETLHEIFRSLRFSDV